MHHRVLSFQVNLLLFLPLAFLVTVFRDDELLSLRSVNFLKTSSKGLYSEIKKTSLGFQLLPSHTNSSGLYRSTFYVQIKRYLVNPLCLHKCRYMRFADIKRVQTTPQLLVVGFSSTSDLQKKTCQFGPPRQTLKKAKLAFPKPTL